MCMRRTHVVRSLTPAATAAVRARTAVRPSCLDSAGCFTVTGIPALSGDTLPPGTYDVTAYQDVNGRWRAMASTTVTVVSG